MATTVNRIPFNTVPQKWAFDPEIGPFIRDILTIIWQQRTRSGGDGDEVAVGAQDNSVLVMQAMEAANQALGEIGRLKRQIELLENAPSARFKRLEREIARLSALAPAHPRKPALDYIDFNKTPAYVGLDGRVAWNNADDTLNIHQSNGVTLQVGLEEITRFTNNTGSTIANGSAVGLEYSGGVTLANIVPFIADGTMPQLNIVGVVTEDVADGEQGRITVRGAVRDIDTSAWAVGDVLYPSTTVAGELQNTKPTSPDVCIPIAIVFVSHATNGVIFVRPTVEQQEWYGVFSDTTDQAMAAAYTPQEVTFNTTDIALGFSVVSSTQITADVSGLYDIRFSVQLESTSSATKVTWFWFRKNGTDIANSNTSITISGNTWTVVPTLNYVVSLDAGDYVELVWAADTADVSLSHHAATAGSVGTATFAKPAIPSAILSITQVAQ